MPRAPRKGVRARATPTMSLTAFGRTVTGALRASSQNTTAQTTRMTRHTAEDVLPSERNRKQRPEEDCRGLADIAKPVNAERAALLFRAEPARNKSDTDCE